MFRVPYLLKLFLPVVCHFGGDVVCRVRDGRMSFRAHFGEARLYLDGEQVSVWRRGSKEIDSTILWDDVEALIADTAAVVMGVISDVVSGDATIIDGNGDRDVVCPSFAPARPLVSYAEGIGASSVYRGHVLANHRRRVPVVRYAGI